MFKKNKLFLFSLLILSILIVGCGNDASSSTNPIISGQKEYAANGIASIYASKGLKFFSVDGQAYNINFDNGGINGLTTSNAAAVVNFDRSSIYSKETEGDKESTIGENGRIYLIYGNGYKGSIILPYTDTYMGHVRIANSDETEIIEGLIDIDRPKNRKLINDSAGTWTGRKSNNIPVELTIDADFINIKEGSRSYKIPGNFFLLGTSVSPDIEFKVYGNIYMGTTITTVGGGINQYKVSFNKSHNYYEPIIENNKVTSVNVRSSTSLAEEFTVTKN